MRARKLCKWIQGIDMSFVLEAWRQQNNRCLSCSVVLKSKGDECLLIEQKDFSQLLSSSDVILICGVCSLLKGSDEYALEEFTQLRKETLCALTQ